MEDLVKKTMEEHSRLKSMHDAFMEWYAQDQINEKEVYDRFDLKTAFYRGYELKKCQSEEKSQNSPQTIGYKK